MSERITGKPSNFSELGVILGDRDQELGTIIRELEVGRALDAKRIALKIEELARRGDDNAVVDAAMAFMEHVAGGETPETFGDRYPQHADVPLGHIFSTDGEEQLVDLLKFPGGLVYTASRIEAGEMQGAVDVDPDGGEPGVDDDAPGDFSLISSERRAVAELFTNDGYWVTDRDDGERYIARRMIENLLVPRDRGTERNAGSIKTKFIVQVIKPVKEDSGKEAFGRQLRGQGRSTFYTEDEFRALVVKLDELDKEGRLGSYKMASGKYKDFKKK